MGYRLQVEKSLGLQRVVKSMVAGLHQHRSLGFPNHFVFGMTQLDKRIEVLAAHWVLKPPIFESQGTTQEQSEPFPEDVPVSLPGLIVMYITEEGERSTRRRKASEDTNTDAVPQDDDYHVRDQIPLVLFCEFMTTLDQDILIRSIFC
jgi:hypothetical protein